ncbi:MAG: SEC-C domain-containing protein [Thiohalocapsa sp.]|uniref:SEC-C metal-binding domain-containing protein n=1 Tax=Thiohalocapsa sp. TaxID=2497641 RepID=UPI0025F05D01|nr:SEC-C metal-binding domain-containing protein [Thiohalocapsa sp.]MCG6940863.1 SEC-C domain-containing protein [Thiohalocapsa sp.]
MPFSRACSPTAGASACGWSRSGSTGTTRGSRSVRQGIDPDPRAADIRAATARSGVSVFKDKEVGRNDPCPCGSGRKYKKCCMN